MFAVAGYHAVVCDAFIYLMQCTRCDEDYIGQTGDRMAVHRQTLEILVFNFRHVSIHMAVCARNCENLFRLFPLYKIK